MVSNIIIDESTKRDLDIQYILDKITTITPYGNIYRSRMKGFERGQEQELIEELEKIEAYKDIIQEGEIIRQLEKPLHSIKDLRMTIRRTLENIPLTEVELFEIKNFLLQIKEIEKIIKEYKIPIFNDTEIKRVKSLEVLLDPEGTEIPSFYIYDGYSEELQRTRQRKRELDKEIKSNKNNIMENIKKELGISLRPDSTIGIKKEDKELIHKIEGCNDLRYISETYSHIKFGLKTTEEIKEIEEKILGLKIKEEKEELRIREYLSKEIGKRKKEIFRNMANIGRLDLFLAKGKYALEINGVKPKIMKEHSIKIVEGIHPKVMEELRELDFMPIDIELKEGATCITGANMGGKTVSLKLVGLLSAMAQYGLFVPAKEMSLGLNGFIKTSIGDKQSIESGLSTFGSEIIIVKEALDMSDKEGLILIDELARGTNPEEGYLISKEVVEQLKNRSSITLLTTHYDNIGNMEGVKHLQVVGLSNIDIIKLSENRTIEEKLELINNHMDYRLKEVDQHTKVPKDAINIARIMGLELTM